MNDLYPIHIGHVNEIDLNYGHYRTIFKLRKV